jgi:hypothetical protein
MTPEQHIDKLKRAVKAAIYRFEHSTTLSVVSLTSVHRIDNAGNNIRDLLVAAERKAPK